MRVLIIDDDEDLRNLLAHYLKQEFPRITSYNVCYTKLLRLSNFTFLRGASHPEALVERAAALGYDALALTDECSFAGVVRAHLAAKRCGLPLILGTEVRLDDGMKLVLLAPDRRA